MSERVRGIYIEKDSIVLPAAHFDLAVAAVAENERLLDEVTQLRGNLSLAEEGLANYQQDHQQYVEWASPQLELLGREMQENAQLRAELDAIKRTREQERDYADVCYQNERLRAVLLQWWLDVGGASERLLSETIAVYCVP